MVLNLIHVSIFILIQSFESSIQIISIILCSAAVIAMSRPLCDGIVNAHGKHSTKIQFMCEFEGCDGKKKLKREGPDGKDKVEMMHLWTILTCRLNRNMRISFLALILFDTETPCRIFVVVKCMNYFII